MSTLTPRAPTPGKRLVELDVLRTVAILLVVFRHSTMLPVDAGRLLPFRRLVNHIGWTGVDLFFVLSGFLVGGLLMNELYKRNAIDVRRFIIRRGFKIWPSYYLFLLAMLALQHHRSGESWMASLRTLGLYFCHVQNYQPEGTSVPVGHCWSLAVEEHFYLLLPLLLWALTRRQAVAAAALRRLPWIYLGVAATCLTLRSLQYGRPFDGVNMYTGTHVRIDSLFLGVLLAYLARFQPELIARWTRHPARLLLIGLACLLPFTITDRFHPLVLTLGYTVIAYGYACILMACVYWPTQSFRAARLFASAPMRLTANVGAYSYSIYLWHFGAAAGVAHWFISRGWLAGRSEARYSVLLALYVLSAFVPGIVASRIIEYPMLALRDRLFPPRTIAVPPASLTEAVVSIAAPAAGSPERMTETTPSAET